VADLHRVRFLRADGTHGFSDHCLVELPLFPECAREAGLRADDRYHRKFPASDLATVSVIFSRRSLVRPVRSRLRAPPFRTPEFQANPQIFCIVPPETPAGSTWHALYKCVGVRYSR
jgi:hypothetical protein